MSKLGDLLRRDEPLCLPGVYDALSARIAVQAGFKALYMSGFAVSGTLLGQPDIGLVTASEMVDRAARIQEVARGRPLVADGDNGYGGPLNVARLVNAYEKAGVSCVQLEDQVNPKRCGHMAGKQVVSRSEAVSKIRAAVAARSTEDFLIMARTDARSTHSLAEALGRAAAYLDAGADILFVEAPESVEEMKVIGETFSDTPLVANMVEDGKSPWLSPAELKDLGFSVILYPVSALLSVSSLLRRCYGDLFTHGKLGPEINRSAFSEFNELVGLSELRDLESSFSSDESDTSNDESV